MYTIDRDPWAELKGAFRRMGARIQIQEKGRGGRRVTFNIRKDRKGEYFDFAAPGSDSGQFSVLAVEPSRQHLLFTHRPNGSRPPVRYLCGHDERGWFIAEIPSGSKASTVDAAMDDLKPRVVVEALRESKVKPSERNKRRNKAFVRQGEWFFVPAQIVVAAGAVIHRNEPLRRNSQSKPHVVQEVHRMGGETVYTAEGKTFTAEERADFLERNPGARSWSWGVSTRGASVFARGRVSHPDHKTICLEDWHRVFRNAEGPSAWGSPMMFLD